MARTNKSEIEIVERACPQCGFRTCGKPSEFKSAFECFRCGARRKFVSPDKAISAMSEMDIKDHSFIRMNHLAGKVQDERTEKWLPIRFSRKDPPSLNQFAYALGVDADPIQNMDYSRMSQAIDQALLKPGRSAKVFIDRSELWLMDLYDICAGILDRPPDANAMPMLSHLAEMMVSDRYLDRKEFKELISWTRDNRFLGRSNPQVMSLIRMVDEAMADGVITEEERKKIGDFLVKFLPK